MTRKQLKGHSGCKLFIIQSDNSDYIDCVRKVSKNIHYNKRLKAQYLKQKRFKSKIFDVPEVVNSGKTNNLFYFDMQYIRGSTLASEIGFMDTITIEKIINNIFHFISENANKKLETHQNTDEIMLRKLATLEDSLSKNKDFKKLNNTFDLLVTHPWYRIQNTVSHGDLTLENILVTEHKLYLIDLLDTFFETWIGDISKILVDLLIGWSFREKIITNNLGELEEIKMHFFRKNFCTKINNLDKGTDLWEDIHAYLILDLLRIIPYTKDVKVYNFILDKILKLTNDVNKGRFYEYISNTMRWPI